MEKQYGQKKMPNIQNSIEHENRNNKNPHNHLIYPRDKWETTKSKAIRCRRKKIMMGKAFEMSNKV